MAGILCHRPKFLVSQNLRTNVTNYYEGSKNVNNLSQNICGR
jgi:hypothetical protein